MHGDDMLATQHVVVHRNTEDIRTHVGAEQPMIVDLILRLRGKKITTRSRSRVASSLVARAPRDNACAVQYQQFEDQAQD